MQYRDVALQEAKRIDERLKRGLITAHEAYDKTMWLANLSECGLEKEFDQVKREEVEKTDTIYVYLHEKAKALVALIK